LAALFGSLQVDVLAAFFLGLLGGLGAELIGNKGNLEIPHKGEEHFLDTGFFANLLVGGIAALAIFYILDTANPDPVKFIGISVTAGVGGTSLLTAITEKLSSTIKQGVAETQSKNAKEAVDKLKEVASSLKQLKHEIETKLTFKGPGTSIGADTLTKVEELAKGAEAKALGIEASVQRADEALKKSK